MRPTPASTMRLASPSARVPPALARRVMRAHLGYLLLVPGLACLAMGFGPDLARAVLFGWLPYVCYALSVSATYAISTHPVRMAAVVLAVPAELVVENLLLHHSLGLYFVEAAFVEVTAFMGGLFVAMLIYRPSGCIGVVLGAVLVACSALAFGVPLWAAYEDLPRHALAMPAVALLTATWSVSQLVMPSARAWVGGGGTPRPQLRFDGGWIGRVLAPGVDEELIGPGAARAAGRTAAEAAAR